MTTTELLRDADAAMYRAKARGRDCVEVFSPGTHDATVLTLRTTNELRRGLERREIVPYYQPIVQLDTGHLIGFEVLARWRHPDRGLLGPDQFLPMAEETGLIGEVGAAVLRSSLSQLGQWRVRLPRFANLTVSVNVSGRQLMSSAFHGMLSEALAESGLTADALWLEITESALMSDVKAATVALRELRNLGLHLAVDDFGTGYSSLTYLKRFPVEAIKVDRSFVSGLGIDPEDTTIVEAVVKLGHSLGLLVVAEGVETPLQLARLREINCDHGQGYVFGRPRPAELIESEYALDLTSVFRGGVRGQLPCLRARRTSTDGATASRTCRVFSSYIASKWKLVRSNAMYSSLNVIPVGAVGAPGRGVGAVEHCGDGMAHRHDERRAGLQHPVHLAEQSRQVIDVGEGVRGDRQVDRAAGRRGPRSASSLVVALDLHLGGARPRSAVGRSCRPTGRRQWPSPPPQPC